MLTENQINFLDKVCSGTWTEIDGVVDVDGNVDFNMDYINLCYINLNLTQIPVQFRNVNGYFDCSHNKLTTLKGVPSKIEGIFNCYDNQLTSLKGAPFSVGDYFNCQKNYLTSLEGGPKEIGTCYSCSENQLISLIGSPEICNDDFWCNDNQLTSLEGGPRIIKGNLYCHNNPLSKYLWGIGRVEREVIYDNDNEINEWIITCARRDFIFPRFTLEENINWIKREQKYSMLLGAPNEIREQFSPRILHLVDSGMYNS